MAVMEHHCYGMMSHVVEPNLLGHCIAGGEEICREGSDETRPIHKVYFATCRKDLSFIGHFLIRYLRLTFMFRGNGPIIQKEFS